MQITKTTDYAIRAVLYLTDKESPITLKSLGKAIEVSPAYISITICKLINAGIVKSVKGQYGGYVLARPSNTITLYDIVNTMEKTMYISSCLEPGYECSMSELDYCNVQEYYNKLQFVLEESLKKVTVEELSMH